MMVGTCLTGYLTEFLGSYRSCTGLFWTSNIWESKWWCSRPLLMIIEVMMVILPDLLVIIKWPRPVRPEALSTSGNRPRISWNSEWNSVPTKFGTQRYDKIRGHRYLPATKLGFFGQENGHLYQQILMIFANKQEHICTHSDQTKGHRLKNHPPDCDNPCSQLRKCRVLLPGGSRERRASPSLIASCVSWKLRATVITWAERPQAGSWSQTWVSTGEWPRSGLSLSCSLDWDRRSNHIQCGRETPSFIDDLIDISL